MLIYSAQLSLLIIVYIWVVMMFLMGCMFLSTLPVDMNHRLHELNTDCLQFAGNGQSHATNTSLLEIKMTFRDAIGFYSDAIE